MLKFMGQNYINIKQNINNIINNLMIMIIFIEDH
jgi:hypothetical protein